MEIYLFVTFRYQVASCALVLDCAVHVWDVRRPHVPLATFAEHRDVTTAIAWQAEPHDFLSTSRVSLYFLTFFYFLYYSIMFR